MVAPQEIRCVGQLPVTLTKYRENQLKRRLTHLAPAFTVLSFGSGVMVRACGVAGHRGEEYSVRPSCSRLMSRKQIGEREVEVGWRQTSSRPDRQKLLL